MNKIYKKSIKRNIEDDILFKGKFQSILQRNIKDVLIKIEETATKEKIKKFYTNVEPYFPATGSATSWEFNKSEVSADIWRAVYKYSEEYGTYLHSNCSYDTLVPFTSGDIMGEDILMNENKKILDFGCGPNPTIPENYKCQFYLVEINDSSRKILNKTFDGRNNIKIFGELSDIINLNIKMDVIFSKDTLEHVRHINEHLFILYNLCNDDGFFMIQYPFDAGENHIYGIFEDSTVRNTFLKMGN